MRKASEYILLSLSMLAMLSGCAGKDSEPEADNGKEYPEFSAKIAYEKTRAYDQTWEIGDEIGISGCRRSNVCYVTNGTEGTFKVKANGEQIYYVDNNEQDFIAYYPWNNLADVTQTIAADTREQGLQKKFDFLWASSSGKKDEPLVSFTFKHCMAKLYLSVKPGNGLSYEDLKKARLSFKGFRASGTFDPVDGSTSPGDLSEVWDFSEFADFDDEAETGTFTFIFFPQEFEEPQEPLEVLAELAVPGSNRYSLKAVVDFTSANRSKDDDLAKNEWVSGRQYNLSLVINKTDISVNKCTINPWNEVSNDEIINVD